MAFPPNTFATQSGSVPASELDANFSACQPASASAMTIVGNNTNATANNLNLTPAQVYAMLKGVWPWEVVGYMGGAQGGASWQILRYQPTTNVVITTGNYYASAAVAATGSTTFTIADNGSSIGTIVFSASGTVGAFSFSVSLPYTVNAGDVLTITGPASADATLASANFTLGGVRG